jgi:nucleotide-binding universal stress UspA family protein
MPANEPERQIETEPHSQQSRRHFLMATDGSPAATRACSFAAQFAADSGARITVAAVAVEHGTPAMPWDAEPTEHEVPTSEAAEWTHALARKLRTEGAEVTEVVLSGHAADALIGEAEREDVDLIVIGQHGRSELPAQAAGSVVEALARSAPCPILIVP